VTGPAPAPVPAPPTATPRVRAPEPPADATPADEAAAGAADVGPDVAPDDQGDARLDDGPVAGSVEPADAAWTYEQPWPTDAGPAVDPPDAPAAAPPGGRAEGASPTALAEAAAGSGLELLRSVFPGRVLRFVPAAAETGEEMDAAPTTREDDTPTADPHPGGSP